jgi:glycopeptide antibiotics resistance protein
MSVHSIFLALFKEAFNERNNYFCLRVVGGFLFSFCFSCTQYSWDVVRSFLRYFSTRKKPINTMYCVVFGGGVGGFVASCVSNNFKNISVSI